MDCSVTPLKNGLFIITTTDFFYPSVDDPYIQGKIGCANVLSDLYSMGVVECDTMLMLLAASNEMPEDCRDIVTRLILRGFNDLAKEAGTTVTGGQTVLNPWPIVGGVATSVVSAAEYIYPVNAIPGDVLVLTKPLGTQVAVNAYQWLNKVQPFERIKDIITVEQVHYGFRVAMDSMSRLNKNGAKLMHKYHAHAATDVTGFGIIGHARNLAQNQHAKLNFEIHTLPIIKKMRDVDDKVKIWKLVQGFSAETSGGLLIALPESEALKFCEEIYELEKRPAWIVGRVVAATSEKNEAYLIENIKFIDV